jgi:hypothetical protein
MNRSEADRSREIVHPRNTLSMLTRWSGEPEEERRDIRMALACHTE